MREELKSRENTNDFREKLGYVPRNQASPELYAEMGFKCGLEIHQQLKTRKKLFCRCPAGIYQKANEYDAEIVRHMRPTLSELGEYDGTALMEFKTRKNIFYRIHNKTACTYDIDDTPPFKIDREALDIALEISMLLKTSIVGELHVTRKQYLDGSIPTGFQRTAIVGIDGTIPLGEKQVGIIQLSIEEDSCREVSDRGHQRVYTTDRLGMPLIEMVTEPQLLTPDEAARGAHYLRYLSRSTGKVRTGIGAAREDVNVSITGGTRVEIKGVAHISWIPELTHNEAFRQKSLLLIKDILIERFPDPDNWHMTASELDKKVLAQFGFTADETEDSDITVMAVNLPGFGDILNAFTQPGQVFADEISDRLKVIACLEKPNMTFAGSEKNCMQDGFFADLEKKFNAEPGDARIVFWGPADDMKTALETIEERCRLAFSGVCNETRKSLPDGTTMFERVLPGPDRMYPDTDTAPLPIREQSITEIKENLPPDVSEVIKKMADWNIPVNYFDYILRHNIFPVIEKIVTDFKVSPRETGRLMAQVLRHLTGRLRADHGFDYWKIYRIYEFIAGRGMDSRIIEKMLPVIVEHPKMEFSSVLTTIAFAEKSEKEILALLPALEKKFSQICTSPDHQAGVRWIMGQLRPMALGNMNLSRLGKIVMGGSND